MLPPNLRAYYTHVAQQNLASRKGDVINAQPGPHLGVNSANKFVEIVNTSTDRLLEYRLDNTSAWQQITLVPPYYINYGLNRETTTETFTYSVQLPTHTGAEYTTVTKEIPTPALIPQEFSTNFNQVTCSLDLTLITNGSLKIGNFSNKQMYIQLTNNYVYFPIKNLLSLYSLTSSDGSVYYQPGTDYVFDQSAQLITFPEGSTVSVGDAVIVNYSISNNPGDLLVVSEATLGNVLLPYSNYYGLAVTGDSGALVEVEFTLTWESTLDEEALATDYVLVLSDAQGLYTLAVSATDTVEYKEPSFDLGHAYFKDFKDVIRASSPVLATSTSNIYTPIEYKEVSVYSLLAAQSVQSRRVIYETTNLNSPLDSDHVSYDTRNLLPDMDYPVDVSDVEVKKIQKLPDWPGLLIYGTSTLSDGRLTESSLNPEPTSKTIIPSSTSGWLASPLIKTDMGLVTPESAAWGLITAAGYQDSAFVVLGLRELVRQAKQKQWIVESNDTFVVNPAVKAGFEIYFEVADLTSPKSFKEVGANAFLGFAALLAVSSLTDDQLLNAIAFEGTGSQFKEELLTTLEALALFVVEGVNPVYWLAAYKEEAGYYTYDNLSVSASVYADLFLSYLLSFRYNPFVHTTAARLKSSIKALPQDSNNPIYQGFVERDFNTTNYSYEPSFLTNPDTDDEALSIYSFMVQSSVMSLWADINQEEDIKQYYAQSYLDLQNRLEASLGSLPDDLYSALTMSLVSDVDYLQTDPYFVARIKDWSDALEVSESSTLGQRIGTSSRTSRYDVNIGDTTYDYASAEALISMFYVAGGVEKTFFYDGASYKFAADSLTLKDNGDSIDVGELGLRAFKGGRFSKLDGTTYVVTLVDTSGSMNSAIPNIELAWTQLKEILRDEVYSTQELTDKFVRPVTGFSDERFVDALLREYREEITDERKYLFLLFINESQSVYHNVPRTLGSEPTSQYQIDYANFVSQFDSFVKFNGLMFIPTSDPPIEYEIASNEHMSDAVDGLNGYSPLREYNIDYRLYWPITASGQDVFDAILEFLI